MIKQCIEGLPTNASKEVYLKVIELCENHDRLNYSFAALLVFAFIAIVIISYKRNRSR